MKVPGLLDSTTGEKNPKHAMGLSKIPLLSLIPPVALAEVAKAMRYGAFLAPRADGQLGYGPFNWRETEISASIYIDAIGRHSLRWYDGERNASDSNAHHLAHAAACCLLLMDAEHLNRLHDNRPPPGNLCEFLDNESLL